MTSTICVAVFGLMYAFFAFAFAEIEGEADYDRIRNNEVINHLRGWVQRAILGLGVAAVFGCFMAAMSMPVWIPSASLAIMCGALFSAVFRRRLNRLRGLDPHYISPASSVYDAVWFRLSSGEWYASMNPRVFLNGSNTRATEVHEAGRMAHRVELITSALAYVLAVLYTIPLFRR